MRLLHISDLHFGKKLLEKELLEDTVYAAGQIIKIAREQAVDAILIAGDIYDKSTPTAEAVEAVDAFWPRFRSWPNREPKPLSSAEITTARPGFPTVPDCSAGTESIL